MLTWSVEGLSARSHPIAAVTQLKSLLRFAVFMTLAAPAILSALNPERPLGSFTLTSWEEGLPQNTILDLAQTPDGYLWIATFEGLVRFDGIRFVVFNNQNSPALSIGNEIFDLAVDSTGRLWVASSGSLAILESNQLLQVAGAETFQDEVRSIALSEESVWAATPDRLFELQYDGTVKQSWMTGHQLPSSVIRTLVVDPQGGVWLGFESGEILQLVDHRLVPVVGLESPFAHPIVDLALSADGVLWIGTEGGGLFKKTGDSITHFGTAEGLSDNKVRVLYFDPLGVLWIGTTGGGINRYTQGQFSHLDSQNGMPSDLVVSVITDREGGLWVGTNGGGIVAFQEKTFSSLNWKDGLNNDNVRAVLEDRAGAIWIGTEGGGLSRHQEDRLTHFGAESGLTNSFIKSLHEDRKGRLWIGTTGGGLSYFDGEKFTQITAKDGLSSNIVYTIQEDSGGMIWVGTNSGLDRISPEGFVTNIGRGEGLLNDHVTAILESAEGGLWVSTVGGLFRIRNGDVKVFTPENGLPSRRVFSLKEDPDGTLWVGTNRGLSRYRQGVFQTITTRQGLFDDVVFSIQDDGLGRTWLSSNRGVSSVDQQELADVLDGRVESLESTSFGLADGMETNQCNGLSQPAVWKTRAGKLLYATVQGVAIVDPKAIIFNEIAPLVVLEEMKVDDRLIDSTETLTLEPGQGERLEFRYSGLSMQSPEDIQFRYYLEGFDRSWIEAQNRRVAYYTNIPPGTYTFRVIAANGDGVWNDVEDSVSFQIQPYFYQTIWFPIVLVLLALTLIGLAHLWRLQRLETQNKRLVSLVKARTLDLARANTKLKKLSEIDALTGVANRRKFDETMNEEWKRAYRQQTLLSLLLIDLDFFKQYNDTYGHLEGDEVLKQVATELQSGARRAGDLVARYGGEEFVILIPAAKPEEAELYAERVRQRIEAVAIPHASSQISEKLTISIGVASIQPQQGTTPEDFFLSADRALYRAKDEGRNRISRDQPGLGSDTTISSGPN